jgi:hypothetical protein
VVAPAPPPKPKNSATRVAILDAKTAGNVPPRPLAAFVETLVVEVRKLEGVSAVGMGEVRDMLGFERQRQLLGCASDDGCLAEIGGAMGVDEILTTQIVLEPGGYVLTARRIDMRRAKVIGSESRHFDKRDGEELLGVVGPLVEALYPGKALKEGRTRGVSKETVQRLNPPPLPRWVFVATAGLAGGAALAGGGYAYLARDARSEYDALAQSAVGTPVDGARLVALEQKMQSRQKTANVLFIGAGAAALAAGVEAFFTDWHGDRNAPILTPVAAGGGAGLALSGRF